MFSSKAGANLPKIIVLNDDVDPTNLIELVWAFATRCHPTLGSIVFNGTDTSKARIALAQADTKLHKEELAPRRIYQERKK